MESVVGSTDRGGLWLAEDPRPAPLRLLVWLGFPVLVLNGILVQVAAQEAFDRDRNQMGWFAVIAGLMLLALAYVGWRREKLIRRYVLEPQRPRIEVSPSGERAVLVPYEEDLSVLSAWGMLALIGACLGWAVLCAVTLHPIGALLLVLLSWGMWLVARPFQARQLAGGVWFSPTRITYQHDGVSWALDWHEVWGGDVKGFHFRLLDRSGRGAKVKRSAVAGRHRGQPKAAGVMVIDTRWMGADAEQLNAFVERAVLDERFRETLGSSDSLALFGS